MSYMSLNQNSILTLNILELNLKNWTKFRGNKMHFSMKKIHINLSTKRDKGQLQEKCCHDVVDFVIVKLEENGEWMILFKICFMKNKTIWYFFFFNGSHQPWYKIQGEICISYLFIYLFFHSLDSRLIQFYFILLVFGLGNLKSPCQKGFYIASE